MLLSPQVARPLVASLIGRLPFSALAVLFLLRARELGGTYVDGALIVTAFAAGLAIGAPLMGRLVDRHGQTIVLAACLLPASLPLVGMGTFEMSTPVLLAAAIVSGLTQPPLSGSVRALWPVLVDDEERRHRLMNIEVSAVEGGFLVGPLIFVGGVAAATSAGSALVIAAALIFVGTVLFLTSAASRRWRPGIPRPSGMLGALSNPGVRVVMLGVASTGASFSAIEISTTAFAEAQGNKYLVAPLLAVWGASILGGGILASRRAAPRRPERFVAVAFALTAVADLGGCPEARRTLNGGPSRLVRSRWERDERQQVQRGQERPP